MKPPLQVLIVEDSADDAQLFVDELQRGGYAVDHARVETAAELTAALDGQPWDVILADYSLPAFNGLAALKLVRARGLEVPLIIVTGTVGEETVAELMKAGANDYLLKDRLGRLNLAVSQAMEATRLRAERQRDEAALKSSELRFRSIWEHSVDGMRLLNAEGNIVAVNAAYCRLAGLPREELVGQPYTTTYSGTRSQAELLQKYRDRFARRAVPEREERRMTFRNQREAVLDISSSFLAMPDGTTLLLGLFRDVTGHRQAEAALRESELVYHSLVESLPQNIFRKDRAGRFTFVNEKFCATVGRARDEVLGRMDADLFPPELAAKYQQDDRQVMETRQPYTVVEEHVANHHLHLFMEVIKTPITDAAGAVIGVQGVFWDVTEREMAAQKLRESEAALAMFFRASPALISIATVEEGRLIHVNERYCEFFGYSHEEMIGKTVNELKLWAKPEERVAAVERLRQTGEVHDVEVHCRLRSGEVRHVLGSMEVIDLAGEIEPVLMSTFTDITERKRAEAALRASEERYRSLVDLAPTGIFVNLDNQFAYVNEAFCRIVGASSPEQLLGKSVFDRYQPEFHDAIRQRIAHVLETGEPVPLMDQRYLRLDGSPVEVETTATCITFQGRRATQVMVNDVTQRRQAENAVRVAEEKYRSIFANAVEGIYQSTPEGRYLAVNPAMARIFGYASPEDMIASVTDIARQIYARPEAREEFQRLLREGGTAKLENEARRKDGSTFWIAQSCRVVKDAHGRVLYYEGSAEDITDRRRMEKQLAVHAALGQQLNAALQATEAARIIVEAADELFGWDACTLDLYDAQTDRCHPVLCLDVINGRRQDVPPAYADAPPTPSIRRAIEHGAELILREEPPAMTGELLPFGDTSRPSASILIVPVRDGQKIIGVLSIQSYRHHAYTPENRDALQALADHCGGALERIQRRAEQEQERILLRTMVDNLPAYIFVKDAAGHYLLSNEAHTLLLGAGTETELLHKTVFDRFPARVAEAYDRDDQELLRTGTPVIQREEFFKEEGQERWYSLTKVPLRDKDGKIIGLIGIKHDITARKQTEEKLAAERNLLHTMVDNLPAYVFVKDTEGRYLLVNEPHRQQLGLGADTEILGKTSFDFFPAEIARRYATDDQTVVQTGQPVVNREEPYETGGKHGWFLTTKVPLRDAQGRITGLVGIAHDITPRKQAEEKIREQLDELLRWQTMMLNREDRVQELKAEVNELLGQQGQPARYSSPAKP